MTEIPIELLLLYIGMDLYHSPLFLLTVKNTVWL